MSMTSPSPYRETGAGRQPGHDPYVRQPRFRRYELLGAMLGLLVLYAVILLPKSPKPSTGQWLVITGFFFLVLAWLGVVTTDNEKPTWMAALAAIAFLLVFGWL